MTQVMLATVTMKSNNYAPIHTKVKEHALNDAHITYEYNAISIIIYVIKLIRDSIPYAKHHRELCSSLTLLYKQGERKSNLSSKSSGNPAE